MKESASSGVRVFISYGRKDSSELARRLEVALAKEGFDVWLDTSKLRAGRAWEQQIVDGLRETKVVIALLSPHSTRRDDTASGDSVCLDELALARYRQPSIPIVPVLAVKGASIPLTIFRLHYLDFVDSLASESMFRHKVAELQAAIDSALSGHTQYRSWESWLPGSLEFDRFLYTKHHRFTGRDWLFKEIDFWRKNAIEPALLIKGDPGIGKSSIVAELAYGRLTAATLATYCCQWDVTETLRPAAFVRTIAYQLASRIPQYADQIETPEIRRMLENVELDPPSAFELGVLTPLGRLDAPSGGPSLLCIDALDEAVTLREGPSIVSLLESRIDRLPSWLRLIATTRDDKIVMRQLGQLRATVINASGEDNIRDLRNYVSNQLEEPAARAALDEAAMSPKVFLESLLQQSEGSFLYAEHFLQGVLRGGVQVDELGDLPPGLDGTYERYLRRAFPATTAIDQIRPVLEILCAAEEPIPRSLVAEAADLNERTLIKLLAPLTPFVRHTRPSELEPRLVFWHKSFYDFLTALENADSDFGIDQKKGDEMLASLFVHRLLRKAARFDGQNCADFLPDYLRSRGLDHLALCGRFFDELSDEQVTHLVCCSSWVSGGLAVGGLPTFAPAFVSKAIAMERLDAIERLVGAFEETARHHYIDSGLIRVEKRPDGTESGIITLSASKSEPLHRALAATALAVSVVDQLLAQRVADSRFSAVAKRLDFMRYIAGGLDIAGWSRELSDYFEYQGGALYTMISNLQNGLRAQTWK